MVWASINGKRPKRCLLPVAWLRHCAVNTTYSELIRKERVKVISVGCRSCVVRVAEGEVDQSDVSSPCFYALPLRYHLHLVAIICNEAGREAGKGSSGQLQSWEGGDPPAIIERSASSFPTAHAPLPSPPHAFPPHLSLQIADLSFTLTDDEVAQGMALTCMSRPVSDTVRSKQQVALPPLEHCGGGYCACPNPSCCWCKNAEACPNRPLQLLAAAVPAGSPPCRLGGSGGQQAEASQATCLPCLM